MPTFYVAQPLGYSIQTAEIDNDAVTYAKMQNVSATDKVLGRSTAGAGDVEEIACTSAGRALIDDASAAAQRTTLGLGDVALETAPLAVAKGGTALTALGAANTLLAVNTGATANAYKTVDVAIRDAITGTGSQVLRRNAGNTALEFAAAAGAKEIKIAVAVWTVVFTTSTVNTDITGATVTLTGLTAGKTYSLFAICSGDVRSSGATWYTGIALFIDGTIRCEIRVENMNADTSESYTLSGVKTGVTGATSYIAKLQKRQDASSVSFNVTPLTSSITLIAIEE